MWWAIVNRVRGRAILRRHRRQLRASAPARQAEYDRITAEFAATPRRNRPITLAEGALIALAIDQLDSGREEAMAQLAVATHGGMAHAGTHVCFDIHVPESAPKIPSGHVPYVSLSVEPEGPSLMATVELFIEDGRLSSIDLSEIHEDQEVGGTRWPELSRVHG